MNYVENRKWYALYTNPRCEFKAEMQLKVNDIDCYLPKITRIKQWSDRKKKVTEPLLRGYIFIYASEIERCLAVEQDAIIRCVFDQGRPAKIHDFEIENLRNFINDTQDYFILNGLIKGVQVRIFEGPFAGVVGTLIEEPKQKSIAVSIELLNRTVVAHFTEGTRIEIVNDKAAI